MNGFPERMISIFEICSFVASASEKCKSRCSHLCKQRQFLFQIKASKNRNNFKDDSNQLCFKESTSQYCKKLSTFEFWLELAWLKVSKSQNKFMMSPFLPKNKRNIALPWMQKSLQYFVCFWEKWWLHKFVLRFTDL